jgi:hypothetical protein
MNGTSTVVNIDLLGTEGTAALNDGDDANVDNLTVNLSGVQPASAVATINITSSGDLVGFVTNNDLGVITARAGSTINLDGNAATQIDGLAARGTIDASALTGDLLVEGSEATLATVTDAALSGADVITLSAGDNIVEFSSALDSGVVNNTAGAPADALFVDVINGFAAGADGDVLDATFSGAADADYTAIAGAVQDSISLLAGAAATLEEAADLASAGLNLADEWTAFSFQGQTYALYSATAGGDFDPAADLLVQITGVAVADLTDANFA